MFEKYLCTLLCVTYVIADALQQRNIIIIVFTYFSNHVVEIFLHWIAYYLTKCVKEDPDVNECLIHAGNRLIEFLRKGVPELDIIEVSFYFFFYIITSVL